MGFGFAELLMVLLLGSSLPSDVEPLPPDQLLNGMPAECELLLIQDVRGSYEALNELIEQLSTQPWIMGNRDLVEGISEMRSGLDSLPAEAVSELGFNPFTDVTSAGLCGRLATSPSGEPVPSFIVIVQGSFPASVGATLAGQIGLPQITLSNGATAYGEREDGVNIGMASPADGLLLIGSEDLLGDRLVAPALPQAWQSAPANSLMGRVAALSPGGPRTVAGFAPSAGTRFLIGGEAPVTFAQLIAGLDRALVMSNGSISYIETVATNADAQRDFELILSGIGAYMEAAPHATRALADIFLGVLSPDDPEIEEPFRAMLRSRDDVLNFLDGMGVFTPATVTYNADASTMTTSLEINTPEGLASLGVLMGVGAAVFMVSGRGYEEPPSYYYEEPIEASPPAPASP